MPQRTRFEIEERRCDAEALLNNPMFQEAMQGIWDAAIQKLLIAPIGDLTATQAHATMRAIDEIRNHLKSVVNDDKMASQRSRQQQESF